MKFSGLSASGLCLSRGGQHQRLPLPPQLLGPLSVHAGSLDEKEKRSAEQQHNGNDQATLQGEVQPEVFAEVQAGGEVFYAVDRQEVEEVDAVAHPANVGDDRMAEYRGADSSAKRREIQKYDHKGKDDVATVTAHEPHKRPKTEGESIPEERRVPFRARQV